MVSNSFFNIGTFTNITFTAIYIGYFINAGFIFNTNSFESPNYIRFNIFSPNSFIYNIRMLNFLRNSCDQEINIIFIFIRNLYSIIQTFLLFHFILSQWR